MRLRRLTAPLALLIALATARCDCGGPIAPTGDGAANTADAASDAMVGDAVALDTADLDATRPDSATGDSAGPDSTASHDAAIVDATSDAATDAALHDASAIDTSTVPDASTIPDASSPLDASAAIDGNGPSDAGAGDAATGDDSGSPTGLSTPCQNGSGWTLFRFHYSSNSTSAQLDVWDATCDYSFANQACNVTPVWSDTFVHDGYALLVDGAGYIRVRFSVNGLSFSRAAVHINAVSYDTTASTTIRVRSPLYGENFSGLVDNDWTFEWYAIDWTGYLYPDDDPDLTAILIYAYQGSSSLGVHAVELCVE